MIISSVSEILQKQFKHFTKEEQLEIVKQGRFTDLTNLCQNDKGKYRMFATSWYKKVKWLTGNTVNRRLYCWHCVLFPSGPSRIWNFHGFDDLKNMSQSIKKHEESKEHTYSSIKLKLLMKTKRTRNNEQKQIENNVRVKRNREYLERLIDVASALAHFEIPFRSTGDDGFYKYLLDIFRKFDDIVSSQMDEGSQFNGVTKVIQIDLINSIAQTVRQKIIDEVSAVDFFALQVDEVNNSRMSRQVAVSVRYVREAKSLERFFGLYEVPFSKKSEDVLAILERELEKLNFKEKLVAQSYDGGVVKYTELYNLQQSIKQLQGTNPKSLLVHCYAHELSGILSQSLHSLHECKLFFSMIDLFSKFFKNIALIDVLPNVPASWTDSIYSCINTIHKHSISLIQVLEFINSAEEYQNSTKVISDSINLIFHLKSFKFMLFVHIFQTLFSSVEESIRIIREKAFDTMSCRKEANKLIEKLKGMKREQVFKALISSVPSATGQQVIVSGILDLYLQILDNIIYEVEGRFLDIELTEFCALVCLDNIPSQAETKKVPDNSYLQAVKENYSNYFDAAKLKSELDLLYSDPSIVGIGEDIALTKLSEILMFMYEHEINNYLPTLYKFLTLVVTIPSIADPLEGKECVLNRIKDYRKTEKNEDPKGALALLIIEKELFYSLEKSQKWYEHVINNFSILPSTSDIELNYKNTENVELMADCAEKFEITEPDLDIKSEVEFY